jgi:TPR repeat protein
MGSMFWEGDRVGAPFHTDVPQAFAWHLVAARAGYHNSQYDLGWLLLSGRAPGINKEQGENNGLFWLRRAAERDQQFAKKKLEEGGYAESEEVGPASDRLERVLETGRWILRHVL